MTTKTATEPVRLPPTTMAVIGVVLVLGYDIHFDIDAFTALGQDRYIVGRRGEAPTLQGATLAEVAEWAAERI
jgi:hypothetical protein